MTKKIKFILFILLALGFCLNAAISLAQNSGFVQRQQEHLDLNGQPFYFSSSNQYYLFYKPNYMVDEVLEDAAALGLRVFRTWGSCEGIQKDDYWFQPEAGVYDENTFRKMDYIIYKANEQNIRLIIPLVNNWDDGFGGMKQYVLWSHTNLTLDLYNPAGLVQAAIAISTGDSWVWHESLPKTLVSGWNTLSFDLSSSDWKKAPDWGYTHPISDLDQVKRLSIILYNYSSAGSVYLDNIRLGPAPGSVILWDGVEQIGGWQAASTWSDATSLSPSSSFKTEGLYSLKLDYDPTKGNAKAAWLIDTDFNHHDAFYTDANCKQMYKDYVYYFLNRQNSITGIRYKDDPTILMWELANEPRCESDLSGDTLQAWINEMAGFIKSIDSNHLVSTGQEGWYNEHGTDFIRNHQDPYIDICSLHLFPNDNALSEHDAEVWIKQHTSDAKKIIGKPVYMGEFGWKIDRTQPPQAPQENILHNFNTSTDGWYNHWGYDTNPIWVDSPSADDRGAIKYTKYFTHDTDAGGAVWYDTPKDLSGYQYISAWVRTPSAPQGTWFSLQLYTKSNFNEPYAETWSLTPTQGWLMPERWYQVKMNTSEIYNYDSRNNVFGDPHNIRSIGIKIGSYNTEYFGEAYYDLIEAYSDAAIRNRVYQDWCNLVNDTDADGAGFWLLSGHQEDGDLYPDYDHYTVYYPEDGSTCTVIQDFSAKMNDKRWILNLPAPLYLEEQSFYSAAASLKMALDYIRQNTILTQGELYNYGHARNHANNSGILEIDPLGLQATLMYYAPPGYNFTIRALSNITDLMRDICHWLDYEVPFGTIPNTPILVPTYGGYDNWMVVRGAVASADPLPNPADPWYTPAFTVYGFWLNDPSVNGIGANSYKTAAECQATYFKPLVSADPWNGKYLSVAEPPEVLSTAQVDIAGPKLPGPSGDTLHLLNSAAESSYSAAQSEQEQAPDLKDIAWEEIIDPALMRNQEFRSLFDYSVAKRPLKVRRLDRPDADYWLVPFHIRAAHKKKLTSIVVILDANAGYFKEASWNVTPVEYLPMTKNEAIACVERYIKVNRHGFRKGPADANLVWQPALSPSPYYPLWRVEIGKDVYLVTQDGAVKVK